MSAAEWVRVSKKKKEDGPNTRQLRYFHGDHRRDDDDNICKDRDLGLLS